MITYIDDDGFSVLHGRGRLGCAGAGRPAHPAARPNQGDVIGVIGKKPIHLHEGDEREKASKIEDLWIDIGAGNGAEAQERVRVGSVGRDRRPDLRVPEPPAGLAQAG